MNIFNIYADVDAISMTPSRNTRSYTLRSIPSSPGRSFFAFEFNRTKHVFFSHLKLFNDFIPLGYLTNLDIGKVEHGCSKSSTTDAQITLLLCYYRYINEQDSHYNCCQLINKLASSKMRKLKAHKLKKS